MGKRSILTFTNFAFDTSLCSCLSITYNLSGTAHLDDRITAAQSLVDVTYTVITQQ